MAIFKRNSGDGDSGEVKKDKGSWKRPANTAFKQQRLKAWQPILTPRTVLPTLFIIAIIFAPIGAVLLLASHSVSQITLDYTDCDKATGSPTPIKHSDYQLKSSDSKLQHAAPTWTYDAATKTCNLQFELPAEIGKPVFIYYKLTNFYQNHRRYVRSLDSDQLLGKERSASALDNSDCKPLGAEGGSNGKPIYPCGLIANSIFNDTIGNPVLLNPSGGTDDKNQTYTFLDKGIAWPGERNKYTDEPKFKWSDVVPPPNWRERYPSYNDSDNGHPKLASDEHFQNWMRTAGLPTFSKLYGRNDDAPMAKGNYQISIGMNFPVTQFGGTKSIVISNGAWIGGKNPFLGWAYIATAGLFMLLALAGTLRHCIRPRKLGDMSLLSWNQPAKR